MSKFSCAPSTKQMVYFLFSKTQDFFSRFCRGFQIKPKSPQTIRISFFSKLVKLRIFEARNVTVRVTCNVYHNFLQKNENRL